MNKLLSKLVLVGLVFSSVTLLNTQKTFAQSLNLFGVVDNGPGDLDPTVGRILLANFSMGNGTLGNDILFSGSATEFVSNTRDVIVIAPFTVTNPTNTTNTFSGVVTNNYPFLAGTGYTFAFIHNISVLGGNGNASLSVMTTATSFDNNSAEASAQGPANAILNAFQQKNGNFSGPGQLIVNFAGNLSPGQSLSSAHSSIHVAQVVPVPSSLYGTLAVAALGAGAIMRRNLRRNRSLKLESIG
ncbi:MAG: hypothetical protein WCO45_11240 [Pseudanabaena sp. ELA607]